MKFQGHTIQAVLLDWAGTTVDYGSRCPAQVFVEIFRLRGIEIRVEEAREPMGRAKHDHILQITQMPRVAKLWVEKFGKPADQSDVLSMYHEFLPLQKQVLQQGSSVIPGVADAINKLRAAGLKIGSSTGYTRELMSVVVPEAAAQGYEPEVVMCADDAPAGRPAPWLNLRAAELLNVYPMSSIVVVDDTVVGIQAAKNAGMHAVAVSLTGNALGLSEEEVQSMPRDELARKLAQIEQQFLSIGADVVIQSVAELPELLTTN
ncbi:MAG: phosphonoacetaldehyde hydrolase [Planctomyces sp.]|nr:phosphonoacetaldehyde hydrolase [Planctomyces sp.]